MMNCMLRRGMLDLGLDGLGGKRTRGLIRKYGGFRSPFAEEIVDWLQGQYVFDPACLTE